MTRVEELTPLHIERWENGDPGIAAVRATDPDIFRCPFCHDFTTMYSGSRTNIN